MSTPTPPSAGPTSPRPTPADVAAAARTLGAWLPPTPLQRNDRLSAALGLDVWLKREDLQPVRSYKVRGAAHLISGLTATERERGVTCASAGNHAQGVALACARAGVRGRVHLPRTTPRQKRERIAALGGDLVDVVIGGDTYDDAAAASRAYAAASGATPVPAFDDPRTIAGQATVGTELLAQVADLDGVLPAAVVVPVGGGGLLAGLCVSLGGTDTPIELVGVEPAGAASMAAALAAGGPVDLATLDGFVDGAAVRRVGVHTHALVAAHRPVLDAVPEGLVCVEMLDLYGADGVIAEPAGALATAGLRQQAARLRAVHGEGARVVAIVSGGNNDVSRYDEVVERALVHEGLKHYFLVEFPQEPGALRRFLDDVLGPDDDITLFEYVKRSNRETGPALVGIELQHAEDLVGLRTRMAESSLRVEPVPPDSPLFRFVM
ncbi:threonine ammonia-lyase IlvA [Nocardioides sp.]|uniref:threonine ammonia-lyase IlvA n=1 Tax=Nocardioides sp. TaxID=35761 RepID=UPI0035113205